MGARCCHRQNVGRVTPSYALHPKMVGAWARGRVGAWARGRVGAWARGRVGAWARGRVGAWARKKKARRLLIYY